MKNKQKRKLTSCPICGGTTSAWLGFRAGLIYFCKNCGYRGPLTLQLSKRDSLKLRKLYEKKKKKS